MKYEIKIGDWMFNAGIVGLYNILEESGDVVGYYEQSIEIDPGMLINFEQKYFDYFIKKYEKTLSWYKIVSYKNVLKYHEENNYEDFKEHQLEQLNKYIKDIVKYYLKSASYKAAYPLFPNGIELLELEKELSTIKMGKKEKIEDKLYEVKNIVEVLKKIIDICNSHEGKKYLASKNVIYNIIKNAWDKVCFLNPQTKEKDVYCDYNSYFVELVLDYIDTDQSKFKYSCFTCDRPMKDFSNDLSFLTMTGFDVNRKSSHVWDFNNDIAICPICKLVYSCIPAGITYVYDRGIYINDNSNIENAVNINNKIKTEILKQNELSNASTYIALVNAIYEQFNNRIKYELLDIQIVKYEDTRYKFNILSKKSLQIISKSQKDLNTLIKCGFKEINTYFNIYPLVINRLLNNQNLFTLIHKLLVHKLSNPKDSYFNTFHVSNIVKINKTFLEGMEHMENEEKDIIKLANISGYYLRKKYKEKKAQDKLSGISYRLLNALKTNNESMFMDTLLNCYLYANSTVPNVFVDALKNNEKFKTIGYAFVSGLIEGTEQNEKDGGENNAK